MTPDPHFDTQRAVRALETAGIPRAAAEAIVETTRTSRGGMVTQDSFETRLAKLETTITIRMTVGAGVTVGVGLGLAKLLF